jgi:hypothetical protein
MQSKGSEEKTAVSPVTKKKKDEDLYPSSSLPLSIRKPVTIGIMHSIRLDNIYIMAKAEPRTFLLTTKGIEATITFA